MSDPDPSELDPSHLDPAVSGSIQIQLDPDPNLDDCRQLEKNYSFCTTTGKAGMIVYPCDRTFIWVKFPPENFQKLIPIFFENFQFYRKFLTTTNLPSNCICLRRQFSNDFTAPVVNSTWSVYLIILYTYAWTRKKTSSNTTFNFIVDVLVAFFGMVLITSVRHQMSRRTACPCHRCEKVDRTPRLCSSNCFVPFWYVLLL